MTRTTQSTSSAASKRYSAQRRPAAEPRHYATVNALFLAASGVLLRARELRARRAARQTTLPARVSGRASAAPAIEPIKPAELPVLALATFALAETVAREKVATWIREPFVEESASHRPVRPKGRGMRYAVGELLTCTRCVGAWSALVLVGLRLLAPAAGRTASLVLAVAGANNFLQAGFRWLTDGANRAGHGEDSGAVSRSNGVPSA